MNVMLDVIFTKEPNIKIGGEMKSRNVVVSMYMKIGYEDIDHVIKKYQEQEHKITYIRNYLRTLLYTVKMENDHHLTNTVCR